VDREQSVIGIVILAIAGWGVWFLERPAERPSVPVAAHDLPAFTQIEPRDLKLEAKRRSMLSTESVTKTDDLIGHYVRERVSAGQTIQRSQLVAGTSPGSLAISMEASPAMAFGGKLRAGEFVALWSQGRDKPLLDRALVLDVLSTSTGAAEKKESSAYVVVLAVPVAKQAEVLDATQHGVALTRVR
jgi:Flp pilus assembly protein CpaB